MCLMQKFALCKNLLRLLPVRPAPTARAGPEGLHSQPARAEGFKRMDLGATLPGVPLYRAFGFEEIERFVLTMPDGVRIEGVLMERQID